MASLNETVNRLFQEQIRQEMEARFQWLLKAGINGKGPKPDYDEPSGADVIDDLCGWYGEVVAAINKGKSRRP